MHRDFEITSGIYLSQGPHKLDLHNCFDFHGLHYSVTDRTLLLEWRRSLGTWAGPDGPASVSIQFREVSEFRFLPRDPALPFTEDDCVRRFGYWTDEAGIGGVVLDDRHHPPDPTWLMAVHFMSGATLAVQAASVHAQIAI